MPNIKKNLNSLLRDITVLKQINNTNPTVEGLAYDSRDIEPGFIFFALKGIHTDGHKYISTSVKNGAIVIFHSDGLDEYKPEITYIRVADSRFSMSPVSAAFYDYPSSKLKIIGVTGTNGKSTTVSMIYQLLGMAGFKTGFISTVQFDEGRGPVKNHYRQSTPEATEIHKILYKMVNNGCTHGVIEATSHGLSIINNRLGNVDFDGAVFTNISHEHLEFHKTLDKYASDKANLFRSLNSKTGYGIVNLDDQYSEYFMQSSNAPVYSYSTVNKADIKAEEIKGTGNTADFNVLFKQKEYQIHLNLPKIFNVENAMAALLSVIKLTNFDITTFIPFMEKLIPAEGRMISINMGQDFNVLVDYAHSPGSFKILLPELKNMTKGRLISVFGSAGERDITKRKTQGEIADSYSDIIILTDEDPRGEDPMAIIMDISSGCPDRIKDSNIFYIPDREKAITFAFKISQKDDLVVLLGKGHESTIIYKDKSIPWKEKDIAVSVLKKMGYSAENIKDTEK